MTDLYPYLSVVVAARNDNHGGNLLARMQAFVNGWIGQCQRHGISAELIIVEWNPPADRPRLAEVLRWPARLAPCVVRFLEVPQPAHKRYRHAGALPLYQMIAKNAGIRRARGRFVLATNIDILFSDALMRFFSEKRLNEGRMYRIDRYDVMADVPVDGSADVQEDYCRSHLLRINARDGTFRLTPSGERALESEDIAAPGSGIHFGSGWYAVERTSPGEPFRWVGNDAEFTVERSGALQPALSLEIEPGPSVRYQPFRLRLMGDAESVLAEAVIEGRSRLLLEFPANGLTRRRFCFSVVGGGHSVLRDSRILNFRVWRCERRSRLVTSPDGYWMSASKMNGHALAHILRSAGRFYLEAGGAIPAIFAAGRYFLRSRKLPVKLAAGQDVFQRGSGVHPGPGWYPLERYLGESFRWASRDAVLLVCPPGGCRGKLMMALEPGPGAGGRGFELRVDNAIGEVVHRAGLRPGPQLIEFSVPCPKGENAQFTLRIDGGDPRIFDILNFRVFWCGWSLEQDLGSGMPAEIAADELDFPLLLHTNGCGDFTLMAREHWLTLRGYPEFDLFSMNLDSVFCYSAHHAGFREAVLEDPLRIYHIEHGSGWTPEGQTQLFTRLAAKGIPYVDNRQVMDWAAAMRQLNAPMIFNLDGWGLAAEQLPERSIVSPEVAGASG